LYSEAGKKRKREGMLLPLTGSTKSMMIKRTRSLLSEESISMKSVEMIGKFMSLLQPWVGRLMAKVVVKLDYVITWI
jgi:hypothetical protein